MKSRSGAPRAIVVGAGLMGRWHGEAARRVGARVLAYVDPDVDRAAELASRVGSAEVFAELHDALESVHPQTAHVCTPTSTHADVVRRCLESGLHVVVEKPVAENAARVRELLEAAKQRDRLLCPVYQTLFQRGVSWYLERPERLGDPLHVDLEVRTTGAEVTDLAPDDVVAEVLCHPLSFLDRWSAGRLLEAEWSVHAAGPGELRASGRLPIGQAERNGTASILVSTTGRPPANRIRVMSSRGTVELDLFHGYAAVRRAPAGRFGKIVQPFLDALGTSGSAAVNLALRAVRRQTAYPGLWELVERFYSAAAGGAPVPVSPEATLRVAEGRDRLLDEWRTEPEAGASAAEGWA